MARLDLERIHAAFSQIAPEFIHTPQFECEALSRTVGCELTLKIETLNPIRSFKGRGSELAITRAVAGGAQSVICASAGNLGQAVAYCSRTRHIPAIVIAAENANPAKLHAMREFGAEVRLVPGDIESARSVAQQLAIEREMFLIEDSENLATCEGAATIGIELQTNTDLDIVLIALGGGALATGVGYVFQQLAPTVQILCVQPEMAPAMTLSWRAKEVIQTESVATIADGVAGRCPIPIVLLDLLEVADDAILVSEASIVRGMRLLFEQAGLIVEPSAALGLAAILENRELFSGKRVATIICGSNVVPEEFCRWVIP